MSARKPDAAKIYPTLGTKVGQGFNTLGTTTRLAWAKIKAAKS